MTEAERIWNQKSDDDLLAAAAELETYTEEGRQVIRAELRRRGLEDPVEQAEFITPAPEAAAPDDDAPGTEEPADAVPDPACLRCRVGLRYLGTKRFHEGTHWGLMGELGHLFENSESFDVYVCPRCGHVDLFVGGITGVE
jgi:hypothetical protein